jgi:hypothetical protein
MPPCSAPCSCAQEQFEFDRGSQAHLRLLGGDELRPQAARAGHGARHQAGLRKTAEALHACMGVMAAAAAAAREGASGMRGAFTS